MYFKCSCFVFQMHLNSYTRSCKGGCLLNLSTRHCFLLQIKMRTELNPGIWVNLQFGQFGVLLGKFGSICYTSINKGLGFSCSGGGRKKKKTSNRWQVGRTRFAAYLCLAGQCANTYWTHINHLKISQVFASHVWLHFQYLSCKLCPPD